MYNPEILIPISVLILIGILFLLGVLYGQIQRNNILKKELLWAVNYINGQWCYYIPFFYTSLFYYGYCLFKGMYKGREIICSGDYYYGEYCVAMKLRHKLASNKFLCDYPKPSENTHIRRTWLCYRVWGVFGIFDYKEFFSENKFPFVLLELYNTAEMVDANPEQWNLVAES